jgi:hypothetical protein
MQQEAQPHQTKQHQWIEKQLGDHGKLPLPQTMKEDYCTRFLRGGN